MVIGGGAVASRRIPALLDAGAEILLVSPKVTASLEDLAGTGRIRWAARNYEPGDCACAWLVCACTDSPEVNAAVAAAAEAQQTWYVRADDAEASAAWTPAAGQAGDVRVGVLSGDPRHSAAIRDRVVAGLRSGQLSARHERGRRAGVAIIGGGPGDPGLITVRGRQLLAEADVVLTDRLAPARSWMSCGRTSRSSTRARFPTAGPWLRSTSTRRSSRMPGLAGSWPGSRAVTPLSSAAAPRKSWPACGPAFPSPSCPA